jgi:hypothetical protein
LKKEKESIAAEIERRRVVEIGERKLHTKAKCDMIVKYFSEKVSVGINDVAAKRESVAVWKEQFVHNTYLNREKELKAEQEEKEYAQARFREEVEKERKLHSKSRSDVIVKYFSEKVAPGVHDVAAKKENFGMWKEGFLHEKFVKNEKTLKKEMLEREENARKRRAEEHKKERKLHAKTRSDVIVKYFSEKVSPNVYGVAVLKEGFGIWKEQYMRTDFLEREEMIRKELDAKHSKWREEDAKEKEIYVKSRGDMVVK